MKRTIIRYEDITGFYPLFNAWKKISTGDGKDRRKDVIAYAPNLDQNLRKLQAKLEAGTWKPDEGRTFMLFTEGKWREIHVVDVETRIVYQSLVTAFRLKRLFVNRTFGAIKGRGTLRANKQVRRDLHRHPELDYCIKTDFHHFYPSIKKRILKEKIRRKYKGERAIQLMEACIDAYLPASEEGISIGAVISQDNGNLYLTDMDRFILGELKMPCLARNVDDTVILCRKQDAPRVIEALKGKAQQLGLRYGKIALFPIDSRRIDFCGWAVNRESNRVRKSTVARYRKRLRAMSKHPLRVRKETSVVASYNGILKFGDAYMLNHKLRKDYHEVFSRINRYSSQGRSEKRKAAIAKPWHRRIPQVLERARGDSPADRERPRG